MGLKHLQFPLLHNGAKLMADIYNTLDVYFQCSQHMLVLQFSTTKTVVKMFLLSCNNISKMVIHEGINLPMHMQ